MPKIVTAEKFITLGTRGNILGYCDHANPPHMLLPNQIEITDDELKLLRAFVDLEKAKRIIKGLEIKIKKGGRLNGKKENGFET